MQAAAAAAAPAPAANTGAAGGDAAAWASSAAAMSVKSCESGGNYSTNTGNGYYGAWQFDESSWLANGGGAYAPLPHLAPSWAQDQVAYNYYQSAGWGPWSCA
ncbi:MAG: transglycosylase family protein [Actinobacteria bacterium]|nr:transglycosylase family protein [Actinomycetota bacterium]MCB9413485.1 transglycosylase family protein [Actinomycetota bacterium]